jgi:hypothetical protein
MNLQQQTNRTRPNQDLTNRTRPNQDLTKPIQSTKRLTNERTIERKFKQTIQQKINLNFQVQGG